MVDVGKYTSPMDPMGMMFTTFFSRAFDLLLEGSTYTELKSCPIR